MCIVFENINGNTFVYKCMNEGNFQTPVTPLYPILHEVSPSRVDTYIYTIGTYQHWRFADEFDYHSLWCVLTTASCFGGEWRKVDDFIWFLKCLFPINKHRSDTHDITKPVESGVIIPILICTGFKCYHTTLYISSS